MTAQLDLPMHPQLSQKGQVLRHLQSGATLTSDAAWRAYGITRLSGIIIRLRQEGHRVETTMTEVPSRQGGARVAVYSLVR